MAGKYKTHNTRIYLTDEQEKALNKVKSGRKAGFGQLLVESYFKYKSNAVHEEKRQTLPELMIAAEIESELKALLEYYNEGQDIQDDIKLLIDKIRVIVGNLKLA